MMKLERSTLLNLFKFISFLCLVTLVMIFICVLFNENLEHHTQKKEKVLIRSKCENISQKFFKNFEKDSKKSENYLSYLLALTENKYIYYSFALVLGGVLNMKKIVKTGIF